MNFWSLHTRGGEIFDFLCLSRHDTEKYLSIINEGKDCVLECNYDRGASGRGLAIIKRLKLHFKIDSEDLDEDDKTDNEIAIIKR